MGKNVIERVFRLPQTFFIGFLFAVSLSLVSGVSNASASDCADQLFQATPPLVEKQALLNRSQEICFQEFAVLHSGITRTPLWSAEHLTSARIRQAYSVARDDVFHEETTLPDADRSMLSDYVRSGFDRGHMSPAADMATVSGQNESFSLANMIPQSPALNRGLWAKMEGVARSLALRYGEVYVVTGPAFVGSTIQRLHGRVMVPTNVFKAIYIPSVNQAGVWWADNSPDGKTYEDISLNELTARTGLDVFPGLSPEVKAAKVTLPSPNGRNSNDKAAAADSGTTNSYSSNENSRRKEETSTWGHVGFMLLHKLLR